MSVPIDHTLTDEKPVEIKSVKISLLDPEVIRRRSVVCVTESTMYEKNLPKHNSVNDHRMGVVGRGIICGTCGNTLEQCNGHEGHIEMYYPVYHIGFLERVFKLLKVVCYHCSGLLIDVFDKEVIIKNTTEKQRYNQYVQSFKEKKECIECRHCRRKQPKYKQHPIHIDISWKGIEPETPKEEKLFKRKFTACDARRILSGISNLDSMFLGFNPREIRPEWMIITSLVVPPPCVRPSIVDSEGSKNRGQDDLTNKLHEIVKANHAIGEHIEKHYGPPILYGGVSMNMPSQSTSRTTNKKRKKTQTDVSIDSIEQNALSNSGQFDPLMRACEILSISVPRYDITPNLIVPEEELELLQMHVATYMNNGISGMKPSTQRSGAPTKSIYSRYKGKYGRFRNNLSGKRIDQSARSVITGDPNIDPDQVGIPYEIAMNLTRPEKVNRFNYDRLLKCVRGGPNSLVGANSVITDKFQMIYLDNENCKDIQLQIGWTVERHLQDNDFVAFNRQPSLRDVSLMAHRVKLMPGRTIRLNLSVTLAYNADFDGEYLIFVLVDSIIFVQTAINTFSFNNR
jgi:DNA-directed RNA polymerase beta' subunit